MKKIIVVIPHSHAWFWVQTCVACLKRNPPRADGFAVDVVLVDNSPWSPAIDGITDTALSSGVDEVLRNYKTNRFHASALDCVVESYEFDYLMALETDVMVLRPDWLQWFVDQMRVSDYAVGAWHHEQFVNPSCTLYRGKVLRDMLQWCKTGAPQDELRWGPEFSNTAPLDNNLSLAENPAEVLTRIKDWIAGPFAEKRGFPQGAKLPEAPSGQLKGPGWYEPGQQLHHWSVNEGYSYTVCSTLTTKRADDLPLQTLYGARIPYHDANLCPYPPGSDRRSCSKCGSDTSHFVRCPDYKWKDMPDPRRQLEAVELFGNAYAAHLWGGTRALDILKHPVTCQFVKANTPGWLAREARFWREVVPPDVQAQTLDMIRRRGWHITGQGSDHVSDRDREAAEFVRQCYAQGGVEW